MALKDIETLQTELEDLRKRVEKLENRHSREHCVMSTVPDTFGYYCYVCCRYHEKGQAK
jgi:hypothetical protein